VLKRTKTHQCSDWGIAYYDMGMQRMKESKRHTSRAADYQSDYYPESRFGGFTDVDGTVCFYTRVNSLIMPSMVLVDFGCGRGAYADDPVRLRRELRIFRRRVLLTIGLDVDESARTNPFIEDFRLLQPGHPWPVEDSSVDMVIADSVLEHLPNPADFFSESKRVLKQGAYLCIRTTNLLSYVGLSSLIIPNRYHRRVLQGVQNARREEDIFPTLYRCNTVFRLRKMLSNFGFEHACYGYESEPRYLAFSRVAFKLGVLHQRYSPRLLKPALFAFGRSV
jgi:SAM-dependent methyltransferase